MDLSNYFNTYKMDKRRFGEAVQSEPLEWFPKDRGKLSETLNIPDRTYLDQILEGHRFGVTFIPVTHWSADRILVHVSGPYERVFIAIAELWGSNETKESMPDYVHMLLGDPFATARWNSVAPPVKDVVEHDAPAPGAPPPSDPAYKRSTQTSLTNTQRPIHMSREDGGETGISWSEFRLLVRHFATPQPNGDGGCKVIEDVNILSFDDNDRLTVVVGGVSYTIDPEVGI